MGIIRMEEANLDISCLEDYDVGKDVGFLYGMAENGDRYMAGVLEHTLVMYRFSQDNIYPTGVLLGYRRQAGDSFCCDTDHLLTCFFCYGICEKIIDKFDGEYHTIKMDPCTISISQEVKNESSLNREERFNQIRQLYGDLIGSKEHEIWRFASRIENLYNHLHACRKEMNLGQNHFKSKKLEKSHS